MTVCFVLDDDDMMGEVGNAWMKIKERRGE